MACAKLWDVMRSFTVACCLVVSLVSTNLWMLQLCASPPETPAADCCKDGFCPRHAHVESPQKSEEDRCICNLSSRDRESLTIMLSAPAILPHGAVPPAIHAAESFDGAAFPQVSFDEGTPVPPPKA